MREDQLAVFVPLGIFAKLAQLLLKNVMVEVIAIPLVESIAQNVLRGM